jgi:hypothetical protein
MTAKTSNDAISEREHAIPHDPAKQVEHLPCAISVGGAPVAETQDPWLEVVGSRCFLDWLAEQRISLAFSTYQTGKLFFVGRKPDHKIGVFERTFTENNPAKGRQHRSLMIHAPSATRAQGESSLAFESPAI